MENNFIKERVLKILKSGYLISLGTIDNGGVWVSELIYIYDNDLNIYWMSDTSNRHSMAVQKNSSVAGTITVSNNFSDHDFGLQIGGEVSKAEGNKLSLIIKYLKKKGVSIPPNPLAIIKGGYAWYKLTPTKIELIDRESFGYEKRKLKLD